MEGRMASEQKLIKTQKSERIFETYVTIVYIEN